MLVVVDDDTFVGRPVFEFRFTAETLLNINKSIFTVDSLLSGGGALQQFR